jgi:hypothetical protein
VAASPADVLLAVLNPFPADPDRAVTGISGRIGMPA